LEKVEDMAEVDTEFFAQLARRDKDEIQTLVAQCKEVFELLIELRKKELDWGGYLWVRKVYGMREGHREWVGQAMLHSTVRSLQAWLDDRTIEVELNGVEREWGLEVAPFKQHDSTKSDHTPMLSCVSLMRLRFSVWFINLQR
jgi:hypothetical protein